MDKIAELKAQRDSAWHMERHHREMNNLYREMANKLCVDLFFEEMELKAADEILNNLIHFCNTGKFLDE